MKLKSALLLFAVAGSAQAGQRIADAASVAAPWLRFPASARTSAMGGAGSAAPSGGEAQLLNPAGLTRAEGKQVSFLHNAWVQDAAVEQLNYSQDLGEGSALAAAFDFLNFGAVERVNIDATTGQPLTAGSFQPSAWHFDLAYAREIAGISLGLNLKYISQSVDGSASSSAFAGDAGVLAALGTSGFSIGAALQNFGTQLSGASLPLGVRVGAAYTAKAAEEDRLVIAADLSAPLADRNTSQVLVGVEYWYMGAVALRGGYKLTTVGGLGAGSGLGAGLGFKYRWLAVDYAYDALGELGAGNLVSLSAAF
jgi:hypothetical protein